MADAIWGFVIIGGPILLAVVILYAMLRNRTQRNQPPMEVTERGTHALRDRLNREDEEAEREGRGP